MKKYIIAALTTLLSSGFLFVNGQPDGLLHVYFLNVGQGDAILIRTPAGENILVDGGPQQNVLSELKETLPFWDTSLDYVILTHPDRDHIEGLLSVLRRYPVSKVLTTGTYKQDYFSKTFLKIIHEKNIPLELVDETTDIFLEDKVAVDILFPFSQNIGIEENANNTSLIAKLIYGENEILLTGDIEAQTEGNLLQNDSIIDADILKVAHHGSKTSTGEEFLNAVTPDYSVISVGKGNSYHHPHPSVLKRLQRHNSKILRTDLHGRIEFIFSKESILEIKTQNTIEEYRPQSMRTTSAPSNRSFSSKRS